MRGTWHEEKIAEMIKLLRELLVIAMLGVVSAGAFAQKRDDKRPPKEKVIVVTNANKGNRPPPPRNDNQKPKPDKRGRP
jgi:hypothetical protein